MNAAKKVIQKEEYIALAVNKYILQTGEIPKDSETNKIAWDLLINAEYLGTNFDKSNPLTKKDLEVFFDENNNCFIKGALTDITNYSKQNRYLYNFYSNRVFRINTQAPKNSLKEEIIKGSQVIYDKTQKEIALLLKDGAKVILDNKVCPTEKYYYELKGSELNYKYCNSANDSFKVYQESPIYVENINNLPFIKAKIGEKAYALKNGKWYEYYYQGDVDIPWVPVESGSVLNSQDEEDIEDKIISYIPNSKDLVIRRDGGCMLANGDIFCWGNNKYRKAGINSYGQLDKTLSPDYINTPVMLKVQIDNEYKISSESRRDKKWYNNPYRIKFEKMSMNSTNVCAVSPIFDYFQGGSYIKFGGDLYCNGQINATYYEDLASDINATSLLKRNKFFASGKSDKINNSNEIYLKDLVMVEDITAVLSESGKIYTIGKNYNGALGVGKDDTFYSSQTPIEVLADGVVFNKIFALRDTRTFGAIDTNNYFWIWGERKNTNLNKPTRIALTKFNPDAIFVNTNEFLLKGLDNKFYKTTRTSDITAISTNDIPEDAISVSLYEDNQGNEYILYINEQLELKGDNALLSCKNANGSNCLFTDTLFAKSIDKLNEKENIINNKKYANFSNVSIFKLDHNIKEVIEDYEDDTIGWNRTDTFDGGDDATRFLGKHGKNSSDIDFLNKTFDFGIANANENVTIKLDFYEIDTWNGNYFRIYLNNVKAFEKQYWVDAYYGEQDGGLPLKVSGSGSFWGDEEKHPILLTTKLNSSGQLKIAFSSTLANVANNEAMGIDNLQILRSSDGKTLAKADFEDDRTGWSNTSTTMILDNGDTTQVPATTFLGRFPIADSNKDPFELTKSYSFPGFGNYEVEIEFDFYEIDTWDGERFEFYVNDKLLAKDHFVMDGQQFLKDSNITGIDLQDNIRPETGYISDQTYRYKLKTKLDSNGNLTIRFKTSLEFTDPDYANYWSQFFEDVNNESWGIDNLHIKLKETDKKFVCAMTGLGSASQMYCWGNVARSIPLVNTSLYDVSKIDTINKLFITQDLEKKEQMSFDDYFYDGKLFLKYPTYIGGFDYEFYFK